MPKYWRMGESPPGGRRLLERLNQCWYCLIEVVGTRKVSVAGQLEHEVGVVVEHLKCTENKEL
jgi:hypothetical protein